MFRFIKRLLSAAMAVSIASAYIVMPASADDGLSGWEIQYTGSVDADVTVDTTEAHSGGNSLKIVNRSPALGNVYVMPKTKVTLEAGKKYSIGAKIKSNNSKTINFVAVTEWNVTQAAVGSTFDWTNFKYNFIPTKSGETYIGILIEGMSDGVWVDDFVVIDKETGKNLVTNSGFETGDSASGKPATDDSNDMEKSELELYNKIKSSESFSAEEMKRARGAFKYMPVYEAKNITVDGDLSDWADYPVLKMPVLPTQYQVYIKDDAPRDVEAECKFAQDGENFYFAIAVKDDNYVFFSGENDYWRGDSIQMTISALDESYGNELGLVHNSETGEGEIYGSGFSDAQKALMTLKTSQKDGVTYYEFKFPWSVKYYGTKPEVMLFDFLINDNDGDGRRYCVELAPGISEGKTNVEFPALEILGEQKDWYAWIQGSRPGVTEDELVYEYYIVNEGETKTFSVKDSITGETKEISVPAGKGIRRELKTVYDKAGTYTVSTEITCGGNTVTATFSSDIERKPPTKEYAEGLVNKLKANVAALDKLISKCEDEGISTDYEKMKRNIIEIFAGYVQDDIDHNALDRIYYTEDTTDTLFDEAKTALESYISGEAEPFVVPHFKSSNMEIDGMSTVATAEVDGEEEERPVFYVGYGHFDTSRAFIPVFNEYGANTVQMELGPSHVMVTDWTANGYGSAKYEMVRDSEDNFGVVFESEKASNVYFSVYQNVSAEEGKTYVLTGKTKSIGKGGYFVSADGWNATKYMTTAHDWEDFEITYTVPGGSSSLNVRIVVDAPNEGIYFKDFVLKEKDGNGENLLRNTEFNMSQDIEAYHFDENSSTFKMITENLEKAEENNIAVSLLVSPHYMINAYTEAHGIKFDSTGFINYDINAPAAKAMLEKYLRSLIPLIKDYTAVNNICISNEPGYDVARFGERYMDEWNNYLSEVYGGDINKLNLAYGTNYTSFDGIDFEYSDLTLAKKFDYKIFNDKKLGEWHKFLADIIHEEAPGIPVHAKIIGYTKGYNFDTVLLNNGTGYGEFYDSMDVHGNDCHRYYSSNSYGDRKPLTKEMWYDYQMSFGPLKPVINSEDHIIPDRDADYNLEHADYVAQDIWQGAIHGRASSVMWVWERSYEKGSDFVGSILFRPDAISKVGTAAMDLNRLSYEVTALQKDEREIGIIYSDASVLNNELAMASEYEAYAAAVYNGKKAIFISDYNKNMINSCKLLIIPKIKYISAELLGSIKSYVENGGRVITLGNDSLWLDEHALENDKQTVDYIYSNSNVFECDYTNMGIATPTLEDLYDAVRTELKALDLYNVSVIDIATGKPTFDVEYNIGTYDGKLIVNLSNSGEEKTLKIVAGDTEMTSALEMRTGEEVEGEITVGKYKTAFLKTDIDAKFIDTYGHWAEDDVAALEAAEIANGTSETRFSPNGTITRAEFLALLTRAAKLASASYSGGFEDVKKDDWFSGNVAAAKKAGIISGETFRPNDNITREEMCAMLVACGEACGKKFDSKGGLSFSDASEILDSVSVEKAVGAGLMQGNADGNFAPGGNATRGEAAAVINRYLNIEE